VINRLPAIGTPVPFIRENGYTQADWLLRFYGFRVEEIVNKKYPLLDMDIDPNLAGLYVTFTCFLLI
jgi:predicted DNA-binding helix-hairpin-helix protein